MNGKINSKTRLAPTPSGFLHLGNAFSFITTAMVAKEHHASIFLRIDDLDKERIRQEYVEDVFETLHFLGIEFQEGPKDITEYEKFSQFTRLEHYHEALNKLVELDAVYACKCSRTEYVYPCSCKVSSIDLKKENVCWRLHTDGTKEIVLTNLDGTSKMFSLPEVQADFIVRKKDGLPAYQLASLVDDCLFNINLIVRGNDLFDSTLAQLYLADVMGKQDFLETKFLHHELMLNNDGTKLSKSAGDTSIQYLRKQGLSKDDVLQMLNVK
jgi:glutamyl/glutaminyl-tRNA synthetase